MTNKKGKWKKLLNFLTKNHSQSHTDHKKDDPYAVNHKCIF